MLATIWTLGSFISFLLLLRELEEYKKLSMINPMIDTRYIINVFIFGILGSWITVFIYISNKLLNKED